MIDVPVMIEESLVIRIISLKEDPLTTEGLFIFGDVTKQEKKIPMDNEGRRTLADKYATK